MKKRKTIGIILVVIGAFAVLGSVANGSYADLATSIELADVFTILFTVAIFIVGFILIFKNKKQ